MSISPSGAPSSAPGLTHLLYLHGFRSSPQSTKARQMGERVLASHPGVTWWSPQLPPSPAAAMALLAEGTADWPRARMGVVGSSLGGFYATCLAQQRGCKLVVLNPAVHAARDLASQVGEHPHWHDPAQRFFFRPEYVDELRAMERADALDPALVYALVAKGDEVLDWREMVARYPGARLRLLEGGDHALGDFPRYLDEILEFLHLV